MRDTTVELDDKRNKIVLHSMAIFEKESKKEAIEAIIEEFAKTKEFREKLGNNLDSKKDNGGKNGKK